MVHGRTNGNRPEYAVHLIRTVIIVVACGQLVKNENRMKAGILCVAISAVALVSCDNKRQSDHDAPLPVHPAPSLADIGPDRYRMPMLQRRASTGHYVASSTMLRISCWWPVLPGRLSVRMAPRSYWHQRRTRHRQMAAWQLGLKAPAHSSLFNPLGRTETGATAARTSSFNTVTNRCLSPTEMSVAIDAQTLAMQEVHHVAVMDDIGLALGA